MKIGSLALKGTFAAMLALTALRWMVPVPEPVAQRQRQVDIPGLYEPTPHVAERTFFLPVTEPPAPNAGAGEPADKGGRHGTGDEPSRRSGQFRPNPQQIP